MIRMLPARARSRYGTLVGGPSSRLRAETSHCRQRLLECSRPHLMWRAWDPLAFSWRLRRPFACDEVERLDRHPHDLVRLRRSYAEVRAAVGRHVAVDPRQHLRRRVAGLVAGEHAQPPSDEPASHDSYVAKRCHESQWTNVGGGSASGRMRRHMGPWSYSASTLTTPTMTARSEGTTRGQRTPP